MAFTGQGDQSSMSSAPGVAVGKSASGWAGERIRRLAGCQRLQRRNTSAIGRVGLAAVVDVALLDEVRRIAQGTAVLANSRSFCAWL